MLMQGLQSLFMQTLTKQQSIGECETNLSGLSEPRETRFCKSLPYLAFSPKEEGAFSQINEFKKSAPNHVSKIHPHAVIMQTPLMRRAYSSTYY